MDLNKACASGEEFAYENSELLQRSTSVYHVANKGIFSSSNHSAISKPKVTSSLLLERSLSYKPYNIENKIN